MSKIVVAELEGPSTTSNKITIASGSQLDIAGSPGGSGAINLAVDGGDITTGTLSSARIPANIQAHAWVYFNGTGTVAINDSYNVSSITDLNTGYYKVNYSTAAANAHNCPLPMGGHDGIQFGMTMFAGMDGTPANDAIDATGFAFTTNTPSTDVDVDTPDIVAIVFAD